MNGRPRVRVLTLFAVAIWSIACHSLDGPGSNCVNGVCPFTDVAPPANGVAQFSFMPTAPVAGFSLTALGSLNPPGHTLPTDHVYLYSWDLSTGAPAGDTTRKVYMPATGALIQELTPDTIAGRQDWKIVFRATENFYFYLDHVLLTVPMVVGQIVPAGTLIGTTEPGQTLDFGAFDQSVTHGGFVDSLRYPFQTLHYVCPWDYFPPTMQTALYAQVYRAPTAPNKDGKIDYSVAGELVGDWFLQGMTADSTWEPYGWSRTIAFVYDFYDPTLERISIGGTVDLPGLYSIDSTAPPPATVTVSSGPVAYRLYPYNWPGQQYGLLLVQMTDPSTIKIELFPGNLGGTAQFDANASIFAR